MEITCSGSVIRDVILLDFSLNFSLKTLCLLIVWMSFIAALFAYTRAETMRGNGYSMRTASELLFFANFFFAISMISLALRKNSSRFWLTAALVASILVVMQMFSLFPTITVQTLSERLVTQMTPLTARGTSGWQDTYAAEFATLLLYSWTPLLSFGFAAIGGATPRPTTHMR